MKTVHWIRWAAAGAALASFAASAMAGESIRLRRGLVVPVRFRDELSLKENRPGDRFEAAVADDRDVPGGSRLLGTVIEARPPTGERAGYMDLEFDTLLLPDDSRIKIQAVPIRMDDASIRKGGDGRFTAKKKLEDSKKHVLGGMIGGFLIGKILGHKEKEGVLLGALAGIIMAEAERSSGESGEVVIRKDANMGALFERETRFEWSGPREYGPASASADSSVSIAYEGRELRFETELAPFRAGETWMVPLIRIAGQLGLKVDDSNSRRIFVEDDETALILEQDSRNYRLNGKKGELPQSPVRKNEVLYVPLDALIGAKMGRWSINGTQIEK